MTLTVLERQTILKGFGAAKLVIEQLEPTLHQLNIIYDANGGVKSTVAQDGLDQESGFGGITKAQLDDGMFALTATLRDAINNAYAQLETLAARA